MKAVKAEIMNKDNTNIEQDKETEEQKKVKQLNQEIMFVFERHADTERPIRRIERWYWIILKQSLTDF